MPNNQQQITDNRSAPRCCYLVTGAAGFIASKVCEMLLAEGHTVVGVDNMNDYYDVRLKDYRLSRLLDKSYPLLGSDPKVSIYASGRELLDESYSLSGVGPINTQPITNNSNRFTFHHLDIENLAVLDEIFVAYKFTAVFNLAARAGVRYSMENPHVYLSTNTQGTLNILECMRKHGVGKQVLASTSSLYAGCPMPFTEDLPVNTPLSPYAATKKAAELLSYSYHKLYGLDTTVVRYFTVFGPAGRPDMSIFRFIKWIDEGQPLELFGDGTQSRDFTYIDDIARGTILAAKPLGYEIVNLGGGRNPITLQTVIAFIEQALADRGRTAEDGGPLKAKIAGKPFHIADIKETWADISKAERLLGWKPAVSPEDGFRRTVDWYLENLEWLKDVVV